MFKRLKLKGNNETWFVYISKGNVKEIYKNVFVTLVNKNPCIKTCSYAINKNDIVINKTDDKSVKLENLKEINKTFMELFYSENTITYTNLF
jgi:predicted choloylglycine hydrolase